MDGPYRRGLQLATFHKRRSGLFDDIDIRDVLKLIFFVQNIPRTFADLENSIMVLSTLMGLVQLLFQVYMTTLVLIRALIVSPLEWHLMLMILRVLCAGVCGSAP